MSTTVVTDRRIVNCVRMMAHDGYTPTEIADEWRITTAQVRRLLNGESPTAALTGQFLRAVMVYGPVPVAGQTRPLARITPERDEVPLLVRHDWKRRVGHVHRVDNHPGGCIIEAAILPDHVAKVESMLPCGLSAGFSTRLPRHARGVDPIEAEVYELSLTDDLHLTSSTAPLERRRLGSEVLADARLFVLQRRYCHSQLDRDLATLGIGRHPAAHHPR